MKTFFLSFVCFVFTLFTGISAFSQSHNSASPLKSLWFKAAPDPVSNNDNPFAKGRWAFDVARKNLDFRTTDLEFNGMDQGTNTRLSANLGTKYFVANNFAVGLDFRARFNTQKNMSKQVNNSWSLHPNFTYARNLNYNIGLYGTVDAGIGGAVSKFENPPSPSTTDKITNFGFGAKLGLPIRMGTNSNARFTPYLAYRYNDEKFENRNEIESTIGLGAKLETFLFCSQISCGCRDAGRLAQGRYLQGRSFIGYSTMGKLAFNTQTAKYDNPLINDFEQNNTRLRIKGEYMHYVADNFAIGGQAGINGSWTNQKMIDIKSSSIIWKLAPMVEYNLPFKDPTLNSFFVRGGVEFGGQTIKNETPTVTNTDTYTNFEFCAGLGYNMFFADKLSLTTTIQYDWARQKLKDTDDEEKRNGLNVVLGVRKFF